MFRFAVLFAAVVLMAGPAAQAFNEVSLKKLHALNACEGIDLKEHMSTGSFSKTQISRAQNYLGEISQRQTSIGQISPR